MGGDERVVVTEDLTKDYLTGSVTVHALRDVSVTIGRGEMVAIMGPSGSGKTTLLNLIGCVDRPSAGRYWLGGRDVSRLGDRALSRIRNENIGFVFQTFNLLPRLTAADNVRLPLFYAQRRFPRRAQFEALDRVGLADRAHHRPSQLSGGQQQRVAIARALIMKPAILLADEPTGNLDSRSGEEIMALFQEINEEGGSILMVTHDARVSQHATRVVEMRDGAVLSDYPVTERLMAREVLKTMPAPEAQTT